MCILHCSIHFFKAVIIHFTNVDSPYVAQLDAVPSKLLVHCDLFVDARSAFIGESRKPVSIRVHSIPPNGLQSPNDGLYH